MLFTIGHSNHPIAHFLALLQQHAIAALADVRSVPYSRRHPQFSRAPLAQSLAAAGIDYLFLGDELGARLDAPVGVRQHGPSASRRVRLHARPREQ